MTTPEPRPVALHPIKGRGAVSNPAGRFERRLREEADDGWHRDEDPLPPLRTEVFADRARSLITRNDSPDLPFTQAVNPYRGCEHGCVYCYARPGHSYLGHSPGTDFETKLYAKHDAAALLRRELSARGYRCDPIAIGSVTDAWQPVERELGITRALLEVLSETRHPFSAITKSSLIERDIDLIAPMAREGLAQVFVTVTTLDPELARRWEPRAAAPWRRLETIRRLAEAGIPVGVSVSPLVPFLNEPEIEKVLEAARDAGASSAFYQVLRLPWELREVFSDWLHAHYPQRAARVLARLADMRSSGGERRLNDPRFHARMKGEGKWAELVGLRFRMAEHRLGLDRPMAPLRCDLFVPPAPAVPSPHSGAGQGPDAQSPQLGLF